MSFHQISELETELADMREYPQSIQEQHAAVREELQATSEEVQSANEKHQSVNEELETSKEELESANEALITVNNEMSQRNIELNRLVSDLLNFQVATRLATLLLGRDLTLRRFSPQAQTQFELLATDIGRPIGGIRHGLVATAAHSTNKPVGAELQDMAFDLESRVTEVMASGQEQEHELRDHRTGRWYLLRLCPYLTLDNKVDGAVLVLEDIDTLKRNEQVITEAREYAESIVATVREPLLVLDTQLRVKSANQAFYRVFRTESAATIGKYLYKLDNNQWDIPRLRELLEEVLSRNTTLEDFQIEYRFNLHDVRALLLNARVLLYPPSQSNYILVAIEDVTDRKYVGVTTHLAAIVASSDDAIISKDVNGVITSWNRAAETLFGYSAEEAVGQPVTLLIPADHLDEEPQILEKIRRGEVVDHYETVRKRKDGSLIDISLTVSPLRDSTGRIVGASKIARNISERKRAEKELRKSHIKLQLHAKELQRFNRAAVGRELRMIELKKEVNTLSEQLGRPAPYPLEFERDKKHTGSGSY